MVHVTYNGVTSYKVDFPDHDIARQESLRMDYIAKPEVDYALDNDWLRAISSTDRGQLKVQVVVACGIVLSPQCDRFIGRVSKYNVNMRIRF
jgi:hypothetical protein